MIEPRYFVMGVMIVSGVLLGIISFVYFYEKYPNATAAVAVVIFILVIGYAVGKALQEAAL